MSGVQTLIVLPVIVFHRDKDTCISNMYWLYRLTISNDCILSISKSFENLKQQQKHRKNSFYRQSIDTNLCVSTYGNLPVSIAPGLFCNHWGTIRPKMMDTATMVRFLVELRSVNWRTDIPTAATIPKTTVKLPPIIGSGIRVRTAPNLPMMPHTNRISPATWKTRRLATYIVSERQIGRLSLQCRINFYGMFLYRKSLWRFAISNQWPLWSVSQICDFIFKHL